MFNIYITMTKCSNLEEKYKTPDVKYGHSI